MISLKDLKENLLHRIKNSRFGEKSCCSGEKKLKSKFKMWDNEQYNRRYCLWMQDLKYDKNENQNKYSFQNPWMFQWNRFALRGNGNR